MWNIGWGLTSKCNLNCRFCYSKSVRNVNDDIIDFSIIKTFIDDNFHLVNSINYGTGESTLCNDWIKILGYVNERFPKIVQGITTNGYLSEIYNNGDWYVKETIANCLAEIDVSIDFGLREKHNEFRDNSFVYDWAIRTLELCRKLNKRTTIVFIGTNETLRISNIDSLFELAQKYDSIIRLNLYRPVCGITQQAQKFIPDFETITQALEHIGKHYKILSISDPLFSSIFTHGENVHTDPSGLSGIRILPDGSITPSTYLISDEFKKLNIRTKDVFKLLMGHEFKSLIDRCIPQECIGCEYETQCQGGVFDRRYLWYKNFNKKDPYCPFEKGRVVNIRKIGIELDSSFHSIHDGYLPTMFFRNRTINANFGGT